MTDVARAVLAMSQSFEISMLVKATLLVAMGLAAAGVARRARASVRHLLLAATFAAVLALPFTVFVAPPVGIAVTTAAPPAQPAPSTVQIPASPGAAAGPAGESAPASVALSWTTPVRAIWMAGAAVVLVQLGLVLWRLRRLRRSGLPWPEMRGAIRSLAADAGISRSVDVVVHEAVLSPLTFGTRHPVIVLPADAPGWPEAELRRALVHELEHVSRGDWAWQSAARVACAAWWFHPLVWVAWRRLSLEAERACDDAVVSKEQSVAYAEQLVTLAHRLSAVQAQPTLGMANRSDLSVRVSSLLDAGRRRGRAGAVSVALTVAAAAAIVAAVAPLRAVEARAVALGAESGLSAEQGRLQRRLDSGLYEAAIDADLDGIDELLKAGADVNASIAGDGSPLIGGVRSGRLPVVTLLLDRGADPNQGVTGDGSPLIVAAAGGRLEMVRLLLDRGARPDMGVRGDGSALIAAAAEGHVDVVGLLLDRGATVDLAVEGDENALIQAAGEGHLPVVQLLVKRGADVNARIWADQGTRDGRAVGEWRTPLGMARQGRHSAVVRFLQAAGARE